MVEKEKQHPHEHEKGVLHLVVNDAQHEWHKEYISGAQIKELAHIPIEDELFLIIRKPWRDELIRDDKEVNLAEFLPKEAHFYSKGIHFEVTLIVNGTPKPWKEKSIDFEEVIKLAFGKFDPNPNIMYTVTYDRGPRINPEGALVRNERVFVKNKMIFNVTATDKS